MSTPPLGKYELRVPTTKTPIHREGSAKSIFDQGNTGGGGGTCSLNPFNLRKESEDRTRRRHCNKAREDMADRRVDAGKKRYLVHVSEDGRPYGLGVGVWNETLGKLVRGLDPSYIDIRHQPCGLMDTLIARLNEDFEYSDHVSSSFLRTRIGSALSSYTHELIKIIDASGDHLQWVSEAIWSRLVTMAGSEKFKLKSEQMKYANACRKLKGRIGPIGVAGVTEKLRERLGRTPDPDEIQEELRRDKGQERRARMAMKETVFEQSGNVPPDVLGENIVNVAGPSIGPTIEENVNSQSISEATPDGIGMSTIAVSNDFAFGPTDPDVAFAREHPLGKVVLKQMAQLRSIPGCNSPELKMILDGLMSQIRIMRQNAESNPNGFYERSADLSGDMVTSLCSGENDDIAVAPFGNTSCPVDAEFVSPALPSTVYFLCIDNVKKITIPCDIAQRSQS